MKKIISYFVVLLLVFSLCVSVSAANKYVQDSAGLLTSNEANRLEGRISEISQQYGVCLYIITLDTLNGQTIEDYANNYYDTRLSGDAIIFVVNMAEREWTFRTFAGATDVITDWDIEPLMQSVLPTLSAGRYNDSFTILVDLIAAEYEDYNTTNWPLRIGITLVIALAAAGITLLIMRSRMKTDKEQYGAGTYVVDGSFDLFRCHDIYLYSRTTRSARAKSSSSGGGGGGSRGGRSGRF